MKTHILFFAFTLSTVFANKKPQGAIQLIGPDGVKHLVNESHPEKKLKWPFKDGVLTVKGGNVLTSMPLNSFKAHIEFKVVSKGKKVTDKKNVNKKRNNDGNSGVYIQQRYEIQILNSHGHDADYQNFDCASIYKFKKPDKIVCKPAGEWQSYDIEFHAAKWEGDKKVANARLTLIHNGVLVHDDVEIPKKTGHGKQESPEALPLKLQDHSNPVEFRNF